MLQLSIVCKSCRTNNHQRCAEKQTMDFVKILCTCQVCKKIGKMIKDVMGSPAHNLQELDHHAKKNGVIIMYNPHEIIKPSHRQDPNFVIFLEKIWNDNDTRNWNFFINQTLVQKISYDPDARVITMKYKGKSIRTLKNDLRFLINLGDSEMGFAIRGEVAEMYGVPLEEIDNFVLTKINGDELD